MKGLTIRLIGGIGIWHVCPSASKLLFKREYDDIDVIGLRNELKAISEFFNGVGYKANQRFNAIYGNRRLIFINEDNGRRVDVFFNRFEMSHKFDFKDRLFLCKPTLPVSDLLMTKLQIANLNEKDIKDILVIFLDHEFGAEPCRNIEPKYINKYTCSDWGIYKTFTDNLTKVSHYLYELPADKELKEVVGGKILTFTHEIEKSPKSANWKIRNIIGTRKRWYDDVSDLPELDYSQSGP
ncbi:MAG: hypothetical protein ACP5TZ_03800 [Nitrososphaeria archaeon]